jgi:outer membrane protein assembly factor BamD
MRVLTGVLIVCTLIAGGCRHKKYENPITKDTEQPDKVLYDKGIKDIESGRYEVARLTLNTLMNTYDTSEYLAKAKLAIADSWMREGGSHAMAQAEAEYKDFILFYPTMEEAAEAQSKICDMQYKQMDKADRDNTHALRAEEECRQLLTQFPNSRFAPETAQRLRSIQEVIADSEYRVGAYYFTKQVFPAAANRFQAITDQYPLFSQSDDALLKEGDSYSKMGPKFKEKSILAYQKIVREYPLSPLVDQAKERLKGMEAEIPEADPVAVARMKYEQENATPQGRIGSAMGIFQRGPDMSRAAKSGQPTMTTLRPGMPASIPLPAGAPGVTDVTVSTTAEGSANPTALDTQPDARMNQPGQTPATGEAAKPADGTAPAAAAPAQTAPATSSTPADTKKQKKKKS